ncbi:MAG: MFS transporter [Candidatus Thorarchaeota archaeon]|nr:MFS transporter [Candidatus Thorarchaeota archaeon]
MHEQLEPFCLDDAEKQDMPVSAKRRNRLVAYIATFLVTFTLGTTEIFAPWYIGAIGGSNFEMGWAMGSFGIVYMISPALGGIFSDRIGRRKALLIATTAYILVLVLFLNPFASPLYLIVIRALEGLVFGFIAPSNQAMLAELTPESEVAVLGNFSTCWSAGMIFSPFILTFMTNNYGSTSGIYIVIAVELIMLGLIGGFLQGYRRKTLSKPTNEDNIQYTNIDTPPSKTSPRFLASYLSIMLWGVISTIILALFPAYVESLPGLTTGDWGMMLLVWNGVRTIAFIITAKLPEQSMTSVILLGAILSAISSGIIFVFTDFWMLTISMVLSGIAVGFSYLGALYLIVSATKIEKGAYAGLVESMGGVGLFIGPIFGGWLADFSGELPYLMCMILSIIVFLGIIPLLRKERNSSKN